MTTRDESRPAPSAEQDQPADSTPHAPPASEPTTDVEERLDDEEWAQHEPATPDPQR